MTGSSPLAPPVDRPAPPPGPVRRVPRVVAVTAALVGTVVLVGTAASAVASAADDALRTDAVLTASGTGLTALDVDVSGAQVRLVPGDGEDVELDVRGSRGTWRLERDGGTLVVASPPDDRRVSWFGDRTRAVLRVPTSVADGAPAADIEVLGGVLQVQGDYETLDVEVSGGSVDLEGAVQALDLEVTGGSVDADLADVTSADVTATAGSVTAVLGGTPPTAVAVDVTGSSVDLTLPAAEYAVRADASAGDVDDRLRSSPAAPRTVEVSATAGEVVLREAS